MQKIQIRDSASQAQKLIKAFPQIKTPIFFVFAIHRLELENPFEIYKYSFWNQL